MRIMVNIIIIGTLNTNANLLFFIH